MLTEKDYLEIAQELGIRSDEEMLEKAREALKNGDTYLNTIPLKRWDIWAMSLLAYRSPEVNRAFCKRHTVPSMGELVCMLKTITVHYAKQ